MIYLCIVSHLYYITLTLTISYYKIHAYKMKDRGVHETEATQDEQNIPPENLLHHKAKRYTYKAGHALQFT